MSEENSVVLEESTLTAEEYQAYAENRAKENRESFSQAAQSGDLDLCEKLESEDLQYSCEQNALIAKAIQEEDQSICKKLDTRKGIENCVRLYQKAQNYSEEEDSSSS